MKKVNKKVIVFFLFFLVAFMPLAQADEYVLNDLINKLNINKTELKTNVFSRELNSYPENEINFKNISIKEHQEAEYGNDCACNFFNIAHFS